VVREQYRMTFLLVTHNLSFAARISSRVAVMYLGRIVEQAPAEQFFRRPAPLPLSRHSHHAHRPGLQPDRGWVAGQVSGVAL
jgi:peptide/nickel transport system ATP-binding protein